MKKSECEALINSKTHLIGTTVEIVRGRKIKKKVKGTLIKVYCECFSEIVEVNNKENCKAIGLIDQGGELIKISADELP
jgi:uncharacterized protein Veg